MEGGGGERWVGYVDWRGRPALRRKHGGMLAASFVLVVEVMENLAFLANASNLVTYLMAFMHLSPSRSANSVTNFMGTSFLLALLGGFLSDAFLSSYHIYLISALIEFLGLVILTIQAKSSSLKPPPCAPTDPNAPCQQVSGSKATMLFAGLYLTALGVGGIKGSLPAHGAEQFDEETVDGRKNRSTFFNYFVFCLSLGGLIAVTLVVWVEDNKGWQWGFGISTLTILLSVPSFVAGSAFYRNKIPIGSPLTTIAKVLVASLLSCNSAQSPSSAVADLASNPIPAQMKGKEEQVLVASISSCNSAQSPSSAVADLASNPIPAQMKGKEEGAPNEAQKQVFGRLSDDLQFLNRATQPKPICSGLTCTAEQVEDVKIVIKIVPIFFSTIMLSCCLAQLNTFSVQQARTMDTRVGSLAVPPASLPIFPVVFIMILAPLYDHVIIPFFRRVKKTEAGVTHLQRIGVGLLLSVVAMVVAAVVENKRKRVAFGSGLADGGGPLPITFFWIAFQYLFLGSADLFTLAGLLEFFFTEAPTGMKSLATSLSWASLAMGYYLSSVLVDVVNTVTGRGGHKAWLAGANLNYYHLERFYWLMCVLSCVNFVQYLLWATRYKYRSRGKQ